MGSSSLLAGEIASRRRYLAWIVMLVTLVTLALDFLATLRPGSVELTLNAFQGTALALGEVTGLSLFWCLQRGRGVRWASRLWVAAFLMLSLSLLGTLDPFFNGAQTIIALVASLLIARIERSERMAREHE